MKTFPAKKTTREGLLKLEAAVAELPNQINPDDPITHHFASGVYGRQMDLPKGALIVGKIHRHDHITIMSKGVARVSSEFGNELIEAPAVWVSPAGVKRAIFAVEDIQWITIHANTENTRDLAELEKFVIAPDYKALEEVK